MKLYGNTVSLLDATYRTTKYSLPLFMVVVRTNVEYVIPVAEFVTQRMRRQKVSKRLFTFLNPGTQIGVLSLDTSCRTTVRQKSTLSRKSLNLPKSSFVPFTENKLGRDGREGVLIIDFYCKSIFF